MTKFEQMKLIKEELINARELPLYKYRTDNKYFPVIGEGSHDAKIMFIGEAPGENEAKTGRPFCGRAGNILDVLLESISVPRSDVYVTNIVKDRPPANRDPSSLEIESYSKYLDKQIEIIKPKVIVTLGRFSMTYILDKFGVNPGGSISTLHGKIVEIADADLVIVPLFHPAVAVYDPNKLDDLKQDFKVLKKFL